MLWRDVKRINEKYPVFVYIFLCNVMGGLGVFVVT